MRLVKAALAGLLILALGTMWTNRGWLFDAYRADEPTASVRLSGVDLAFEPTPIEETPYRIPSAPDTRAAARAAGFEPGPPVPTPAPTLTGGEATLEGTVTGPDGPVAGAVVRVERHGDHGSISVDTSTDDEGDWTLAPLAGGRYRVRAWLPDQMTMGRSEVRFVGDDEVASFDFSLWGVDPAPTFEFVDGGPMYEGLPATVAVFLGWRSIDADGLVVTNALAGAEVTIETTAQVQVLSPQPQITGGDGVALVRLRCVPTTVAPLEPQDPAQTPTPTQPPAPPVSASPGPGPGGSLTARSGETSATFALPGCLANPGLAVDPIPTPTSTSLSGSTPSSTSTPTPAPNTGSTDSGGTSDG